MIHYVGYGFNVNDVTKKSWLYLMKKFDNNGYQAYLEDAEENYGNAKEETLAEHVTEYIEEGYYFAVEYLRDIINEHEQKEGNVNDTIVVNYDNFLVFDSPAFMEDAPSRVLYIRSREDFIRMIEKYIPNTASLEFGNVWEGVDWTETNYYID